MQNGYRHEHIVWDKLNKRRYAVTLPGRTKASTITASITLLNGKNFFSYIESIVMVFVSFALLCFFFNLAINSDCFFGAPLLFCSFQACTHSGAYKPDYVIT